MDHAKPLLGNSCFTIAIHLKLVVLWIPQVFFSFTWDLENEPGRNRGKLPGIPPDIVQCQPFCLLTCLKCLGCLLAAVIIFLRFRFFLDRKSTVTVPMVVTHLQSLEEMFSPKPQGFCDANDDHLGGSEINDLVVGWFVKGLFFWKNRSPCFIISGDFGAKKPSRPTKETQKKLEKKKGTLSEAQDFSILGGASSTQVRCP